MRYHNITKDDMLNGEGLRVVLWLSGCSHQCDGCQNPITWDLNSGLLFDEKAKMELFKELEKTYISGITFSGGDPLHIKNRQEVLALMKEVRQKYQDKTIWMYTGFLWEEVKDLDGMEYVDVLIDGKFVLNQMKEALYWRGSDNQRIIDVGASLKANRPVLLEGK